MNTDMAVPYPRPMHAGLLCPTSENRTSWWSLTRFKKIIPPEHILCFLIQLLLFRVNSFPNYSYRNLPSISVLCIQFLSFSFPTKFHIKQSTNKLVTSFPAKHFIEKESRDRRRENGCASVPRHVGRPNISPCVCFSARSSISRPSAQRSRQTATF